MEEKAAINKIVASIFKGVDKKNDALMLMSPDSNWDQFLVPAPCAIALLGELILISGGIDFSLEEKPPLNGFKHLKYPNSFRASLVQISNHGYKAFNEADASMNNIYMLSGQVDAHVKNAVNFLLEGEPRVVEEMLPVALSSIEHIADESLRLAKGIEERFIDVMELTGELLEVSTSTKGVYKDKSRETEIAIKVANTERERTEKEVKESERRSKAMEKEVEDAQSVFQHAMDSIPTGNELLKLAAGDVLLETIRSATSFHSLTKNPGTHKMMKAFQADDSSDIDEAYCDKEMSRQHVYTLVPGITKYIDNIVEVLIKETDDHGNTCPDLNAIAKGGLDFFKAALENCSKNVNKETKSGELRKRALNVCDEGILICSNLKDTVKCINNDQNQQNCVSNAVDRAQQLQGEARALQAEASKALGKTSLGNKSPYLSKIPSESSSQSSVKAASENARYKTENAKEMLKDAKRRQEKSASELKDSNEKLTQVLMEITQLDLKHIDFNKIRDTLIKGIKALGEVREQWGKLVRFFSMVSALIKSCLHTSLKTFVEYSKKGRVLKMEKNTILLCSVLRDVIFEQASEASQIAYVVHVISGTYVQISKIHLMDQMTCLCGLVVLDPQIDEHDIRLKRKELQTDFSAAQKAIQSIVLEQKATFNKNVEERIRKISEIEAQFLAIEPNRVEEIKKNISNGRNFSPEETDVWTS